MQLPRQRDHVSPEAAGGRALFQTPLNGPARTLSFPALGSKTSPAILSFPSRPTATASLKKAEVHRQAESRPWPCSSNRRPKRRVWRSPRRRYDAGVPCAGAKPASSRASRLEIVGGIRISAQGRHVPTGLRLQGQGSPKPCGRAFHPWNRGAHGAGVTLALGFEFASRWSLRAVLS